MKFKATPNSAWLTWPYLPPTNGTLEILRREAQANFSKAVKAYAWGKKKGLVKNPFPFPYCLFYGEKIYAFQFIVTKREWNVEKGFV